MCGIAGVIDFEGRPIDSDVLRRMQAALGHRGPDDRGIWQHTGPGWSAALVHTRLAVIDPTPEGHQPMVSPDGTWAIAYNGELYNYRALRQELTQRPSTASDTEVVLRACMEWGPAALSRFDAMWAMAVVHTASHCGHLSRDPFGIKPLYYCVHGGHLVFTSELRALRIWPGLSTEIDRDALAWYLNLGWVPHPLTIYRHIRKLLPGHVLRFDSSGVKEPERFYRLPEPPSPPPRYAAACVEVRRRIEQAVERQCVADVPLGAFLSGGLDSSVVASCMTTAFGASAVKTFSIGYREHPRYDESAFARRVARHLGTEHYEFQVGFADVLAAIEPMLGHLGEPFADSSLLPTALVSRLTRQHVTVALSGDGGDELFGGYWRYLGHYYRTRYRRLPAVLRRGVVEPLARWAPEARSSRLLDRLRQVRKLLRGDKSRAMDRHLAWARLLTQEESARLLGADLGAAFDADVAGMYKRAAAQWRGCAASGNAPGEAHSASGNTLEAILLADLAVGLPADMLHKVDTASMAYALEVRVPLLAKDVVEYVTGLPIEYRIAGATGKRILRDAFRDRLPAEVLTRRKMGFEVPVGEFLRHELRDPYAATVTRDALDALGIDRVTADAYAREHFNRRRDRADLMWALFVLCAWYQ